MLRAKQTENALRQTSILTRAASTNDLLALAPGQSRRSRRWRDLVRWAASHLGEEKMRHEGTRAQVIALANLIIASEEIAQDPAAACRPYEVMHLSQNVASLLVRLGLEDAQSSAAPGSRLLGMMGESE